jgi:hypothetical protein
MPWFVRLHVHGANPNARSAVCDTLLLFAADRADAFTFDPCAKVRFNYVASDLRRGNKTIVNAKPP